MISSQPIISFGQRLVQLYTHLLQRTQINTLDEHTVELYEYSDKELFGAISLLFDELNCQLIDKESNYVLFVMWSSLDASSGIAYSIDGELPDIDGDFPIERKDLRLEPLGYEGWYYYYSKILH
jgi:hypothetical protein